jgi:hypothetical protein
MASYIPVVSREIDLSQYKSVQGAGRSRRISINPDNATTFTSASGSTSDIFFSIPASRNSFIACNATSLVFEVLSNLTFATATTTSLSNGSGSSIIQAMEVVIQNQQVENLLNYSTYAAIIEDFQSLSRATTVGTILTGATTTLKAGATISAATTVDGPPVRCALPLYSGVLGVGAEQYCPMVDGIRVKLTLASSENAMTFANTTSLTASACVYKLSNIALQLEVMDFDSATMSALVAQSGGVFKQHMTCVNDYQSVISASSANNILIPARFSSVKALLCAMRVSANLATPATENVCGDRIQPQISQYFFTVDGANVPSVPVRVATSATIVYGGEALNEVMKVFGATNSAQFSAVFAKANYEDLAGTSGTGAFVLGLNFESQDSAGSALISGRDLNSSNVYLNLTHYATATASVIDTFALYDCVVSYNMMDGSVSVSK